MTEANDIRSLLTSKSRAKVTPRDASLGVKRPTNPSDEAIPLPNAPSIDPELPNSAAPTTPAAPDPIALQTELAGLPVMGKRLAVNLEESVRATLMQLCDRQDITPEIFFEAAVVLLQDHPELLDQITREAKARLAQRKRAGLVRRTLAMMQKYGGEG